MLQFNQYDLYSKDDKVDVAEEEARWTANFPYYKEIFEKYFHSTWKV